LTTAGSAPLAVLDASVALKWVLPEPGHEESLAVLTAYEAGQLSLMAPRSFMEEVAGVLSRCCRRKQLTAAQAEEAFRVIDQHRPVLAEDPHLLDQALKLSLHRQLSLWDCLYLALAIDRRCNLITADRRFYRNASKVYPFIELL
jgi:predicted nucleic acid-binding protein